MVGRLEEEGLVVRAVDPADRRSRAERHWGFPYLMLGISLQLTLVGAVFADSTARARDRLRFELQIETPAAEPIERLRGSEGGAAISGVVQLVDRATGVVLDEQRLDGPDAAPADPVAIVRARAYVGHLVCIEIEVDTLDQLAEAADVSRRSLVNVEGLVNVVDVVDLSTFIVPAIVDRSPLVIAISTGGVAPVLARLVRERIESLLELTPGMVVECAGHGAQARGGAPHARSGRTPPRPRTHGGAAGPSAAWRSAGRAR